MTEEAKELRRQYSREWRRKNRDRVRDYNNKYWMKKLAKMQQEAAENSGQKEPEE